MINHYFQNFKDKRKTKRPFRQTEWFSQFKFRTNQGNFVPLIFHIGSLTHELNTKTGSLLKRTHMKTFVALLFLSCGAFPKGNNYKGILELHLDLFKCCKTLYCNRCSNFSFCSLRYMVFCNVPAVEDAVCKNSSRKLHRTFLHCETICEELSYICWKLKKNNTQVSHPKV